MENSKVSALFEEGPFKHLFLDFVSYKRGYGLQYEDSILYTLRRINQQLNSYHVKEPELTKCMVEEICAKRPHETYSTQSKRIGMLRQFATFLRNKGIKAYIYPIISRHSESKGFVPYIFSYEEIASILEVSDHLPPVSRYPANTFIYPVLMRLLYSCGLRISEALSLRYHDVDLTQGILFIEKSKKDKSRLVPMSHSMTETCKDYAKKMSFNTKSNGYFFPSPSGGNIAGIQ
ncbi:MAG TPA: tyrosine-type recombinase/integrase [Bacillales bacterium]|nr:tyrosine-type recombinase/integrase [Bacillales bacterium]